MNVPTNLDFALEVKTDRLAILWKAVAVGCFTLLCLLLAFYTTWTRSIGLWALSPMVMLAACLLTRQFLRLERFDIAALTFSLGAIASINLTLASGGEVMVAALPFTFVLVTFVTGLLISPSRTFLVALVASASTLLVPLLLRPEHGPINGYQLFAVFLIFLAAALAAQVTGELYAVTEWALLNYQRERRTNNELFESRQQLEKSLKRSEALSDRLQQLNTDLEAARHAAETAKNFRGQFLANMSHELRTPLNAIIGFSETMRKFPAMYDNVELPAAYEADMNQIYSSGKQLLTLINDILDLARIDAGKLEVRMDVVELEPIIMMVISTAQGLIGTKPIKLTMDLPTPLPYVMGDENRVRQVLLNLYSNAVKFSDRGEIALAIRETPEGVLFSVSDTGIGISPDDLGTIFEEFRQASQISGRDPRSGSGLGLAISRQLVTMMNGRIWAESRLGIGSTFYFTLEPYRKDLHQPIVGRRDQVGGAARTPTPPATPVVDAALIDSPAQGAQESGAKPQGQQKERVL
jgi:signal transduction histidine kinase